MADKSYVTITRDITRTLIPKGAIVRGTECDDGSWDVQVEGRDELINVPGDAVDTSAPKADGLVRQHVRGPWPKPIA